MTEFFPPRPPATPTIYAFASTHPDHAGLLKVGYTERNAAARIAEQFPGGRHERPGVAGMGLAMNRRRNTR